MQSYGVVLTSSARDRTTLDSRESDSAAWLESLLAAMAASPDFKSAAVMLLARLGAVVGSSRGYVMRLDDAAQQLVPVVSMGYEDRDPPTARTMDDSSDPFVVALLSMQVITCSHGLPRSGISRQTRLLTVPFPQPRVVGVPRFLAEPDAARLLSDPCSIENVSSSRAGPDRMDGTALSPYGVLVLEIDSRPLSLDPLACAARLAGPMLSRLHASDAHRERAAELAEQRAVLTSIVNSLPDPIVIIDGNRQIVVQNRRAEHLLTMRERDSEGRRRAVEINNLLLTSHLSKDAPNSGGNVAAESRELNMVDPDDGTDLLFEVLTQPLDESENAIVSVLRDVTDLRRAANEL